MFYKNFKFYNFSFFRRSAFFYHLNTSGKYCALKEQIKVGKQSLIKIHNLHAHFDYNTSFLMNWKGYFFWTNLTKIYFIVRIWICKRKLHTIRFIISFFLIPNISSILLSKLYERSFCIQPILNHKRRCKSSPQTYTDSLWIICTKDWTRFDFL